MPRRAEARGTDDIMVIPPLDATPTDDELVNRCRTIGGAIGLFGRARRAVLRGWHGSRPAPIIEVWIVAAFAGDAW